MNRAQVAELEFWTNQFRHYGKEQFLANRKRDLADSSAFLGEIHNETGRVLDLACGLVSVLEFLPGPSEIVAVDALQSEYAKLYTPADSRITYQQGDGEQMPQFADNTFDAVWHINALDHTPHPERVVAEIRRILKPGGRLYFWVNFDRPPLAPAHYRLWSASDNDKYLAGWHLLRGTQRWSETWRKYIWAGLYVNTK